MNNSQISVIVPCYNGSLFIEETLHSILSQKNIEFEIIIVDDGSTDDTKTKISSLNNTRIKYIHQENAGVSAARNKGLSYANGNYIVFFDADDKMTGDFLCSRLNLLINHPLIDFICGDVQKFNETGIIKGDFRGTSENVPNEILLYDEKVITCPSNYMFRNSFLKKNKLLFNTNLSSTADRFFLLQCSAFGKCVYEKNAGKLLYRVQENSMSHKLTRKLAWDNAQYYTELVSHRLIPENIRKNALFMGYFILFGAFWKVSLKGVSLTYAWKALKLDPVGFIGKCFR
ncbi:MAG: family 2 glycosyl transferase [Bacteroidetes bacterium]|nr:family 2 glycosyl transferase [Bacteroidota bacterium]